MHDSPAACATVPLSKMKWRQQKGQLGAWSQTSVSPCFQHCCGFRTGFRTLACLSHLDSRVLSIQDCPSDFAPPPALPLLPIMLPVYTPRRRLRQKTAAMVPAVEAESFSFGSQRRKKQRKFDPRGCSLAGAASRLQAAAARLQPQGCNNNNNQE